MHLLLSNIYLVHRNYTKGDTLYNAFFFHFFYVPYNLVDHAVIVYKSFLAYRFGLPSERLWISVFEEDDEAFTIWHDEVR